MRRQFIAISLLVASSLVAAETKPISANYELRGFFGAGANTDISLQNTSTGKSQWYHLGDRLGGILVEKADAKTGTATIVVNGVRRTLRIAGESVTESEKEKSARTLRHAKILKEFFAKWEQQMHWRQRESLQKAGGDLFKSHPEYFTEEGSHTPEAKAAMLRSMKESIMAGMSVPKKDGTLISPPENLDAAIESIYCDIAINTNPSLSVDGGKPIRDREVVVEINGHPHQFTVLLSEVESDNEAHLAGSTLRDMDKSYVPMYLAKLSLQTPAQDSARIEK